MKSTNTIQKALIVLAIIIANKGYSQLTVSGAMTPVQWVQNVLVGTGVTVSNVKFNDSPTTITISNQIGSFSTGSTSTNLGF